MCTVEAKIFLKTTKSALSAVRKSTMPIYENLLFQFAGGKMKVTGSNPEFQVVAVCDAKVETDVAFCISAERIKRIVADTGNIDFRFSENRVSIKTKVGRYQVSTLPAADYPALDTAIDGQSLMLPGNLISQVMHCAADRDVRYYLNGVHIVSKGDGKVCVEASNGHRGARIFSDGFAAVSIDAIIPREVAKLIATLGIGAVTFGKSLAVFAADDLTVVTKLVEGKFPDLDRVFPKHSAKFVINREAALTALRAVMGCADEKFSGCVLDVAKDRVRFSVKNDSDEAESEIDFEGDLGLTVGVNVKYLYEAIEAQGESVEISWLNDTAAVVFGGSALAEVLMPMRI